LFIIITVTISVYEFASPTSSKYFSGIVTTKAQSSLVGFKVSEGL